MKRLSFLLLSILMCISLFAQEPGNNLRKTIPQLRQSFPDLVIWGYERSGIQNYKSPEADILFETKNGIVIAEFASFEGDDGYLQGLYQSLIKSFSRNAKSYRWGRDKNSINYYYSHFYVYISYTPNESVSISYDLYQEFWPK